MGCGSSRLKGDDIPDLNSQTVKTTTTASAVPPMGKVRTNFSDIDYEQDGHPRRMTEYAPHETPAPVGEEPRDFSAEQQGAGYEYEQQQQQQQYPNNELASDRPDLDPGSSAGFPHENAGVGSNAGQGDPDTALKPYQTLDGGDWDNDNPNSYSNPQRPAGMDPRGYQDPNDPTSRDAKDAFARANNPANPTDQDHHARQGTGQRDSDRNNDDRARPEAGYRDSDRTHDLDQDRSHDRDPLYVHHPNNDNDFDHQNPDVHDPQSGRKGSWLGQKYASYQAAKRGEGPSDEDVMEYTGKGRDELNDWARDRPGVGGNQAAGRVGTDNGLAAGASWS
ncbi:hypothetical protein G647_09424 [Cladophialophora carrionii CBS 160.54]|uniref:Uncharacterized protein n=1 Tax=Cladophialophora carrionii CBS 160.54 TaxID=1279043 RepID=V9CY70_9EURO|nr:uncharacterized protein G647_09424 [Cladophialophora carrionii CBS 160.54]ETI19590.1 hypothetical protein G647_09424 [Cladophialophora carrionii CBS 160.54]